jgi:peptidoglycan hydrolase-like protein with peptidoglycan-binding domain
MQAPPPASILLKLGSQGELVKRLQAQLRQLGYYRSPIDGIYGRETQASVARFQQKEKLPVDGIAGPATLAKLKVQFAEPLPPKQQKKEDGSVAPGNKANQNSARRDVTPYVALDDSDNRSLYIGLSLWGLCYGAGTVLFFSRGRTNLKQVKSSNGGKHQQKKGKPQTVEQQNFSDQRDLNHPSTEAAQPSTAQAVNPQAQPSAVHQVPEQKPQFDVARLKDLHQKVEQPQKQAEQAIKPASKAELPDPLAPDEIMTAAWANQGIVEPLKDLMVDLSAPAISAPSQAAISVIADRNINQSVRNQSQPAIQPVTQSAAIPDTIRQPAAVDDEISAMVVATLPHSDPKTGMAYLYLLIDDAEGRFKLQGNELRIADRTLMNMQNDESYAITVRRVDAKGISTDKSFVLNLNKTNGNNAAKSAVSTAQRSAIKSAE